MAIPTGMIVGLLSKKGRSAAMFGFFLMIFTITFQMIASGSQTLTYVMAIFVPSFVMSYEYLLQNMGFDPDWKMFFGGIGIAMVQIGILHTITNWHFIHNWFEQLVRARKNSLKHKRPDVAESDESTAMFDNEAVPDVGLEVRDVYHTYDGKLYALRGVSFLVPRGGVFGLLGSNGSGKSTLMHCLTGLYRPESGQAMMPTDGSTWVNLFTQRETSRYISIVP